MSGKGSGIGLHLSRRYARALGGDITVTSQPGRGSCFRVSFLARACDGASATQSDCGQVRRLVADHPPCHILVVDDDNTNRDMLSMMLGAVGFTVEVAESASSALRRLRLNEPLDLVLMDKRMPEMDGYEAIKRIRELSTARSPAVLVVTASGFAEERALAQTAGADGYIAKPVRRSVLLEEISRLTGVRYEYETMPEAATPAPVPRRLSATALSVISIDMRERLAVALNLGDIGAMRAMLVEIDASHPELAAGMRGIVNAYEYDLLRSLLDGAR